MKNSKNKIVAATICGIIIGSIGTSFVGNFQVKQEMNIASSSENKEIPGEKISDGMTQEQFEEMIKNGENDIDKGGKRPGHHNEGQGSLEAENSVDVLNGKYSDGTYEGEASGYAPNIKVDVVVSNSKISDIQITSHNETPGFYEKAFEQVPSEIIKSQSTKVDTVSGATYSSVGIINAVNNALKGASSSQNEKSESNNKNTQSNLDTSVQ